MIACGWCGVPTPEGACASCGRDAALPWTQRGAEPPVIEVDGAGRPALDPVVVRRRLAEARIALGDDATVQRIAEFLDVSDRTIRRWQQVSG